MRLSAWSSAFVASLILGAMSSATACSSDGSSGGGGGGGDPFRKVDGVPEALSYNAVWSFGADDVWIAADSGRMLHFDGATWSTQTLDQNATMLEIWGFAPDDIVAVGGYRLARYDGSTWTVEDLSQTGVGGNSLSSIWGTSRDDLWVGGDQSTAAHFDGTTWTRYLAAGTDNSTLWGSGPDDVYTGSVFEVARWDGASWTTDDELYGAAAIYGFGPDDVWVADDSELFHFTGATWEPYELDGIGGAATLWGPAPDDLWGAGDFGSVVHWNGESWKELQSQAIGSPFLRSFVDIHGSSSDDIWIVGAQYGDTGTEALVYRKQ